MKEFETINKYQSQVHLPLPRQLTQKNWSLLHRFHQHLRRTSVYHLYRRSQHQYPPIFIVDNLAKMTFPADGEGNLCGWDVPDYPLLYYSSFADPVLNKMMKGKTVMCARVPKGRR